METIFYSWQSDSPNNVNRNFIREALLKSIEKITESLGLEDAIRLDQDTAGIPGSPEIFNSILKKIEASAIFVSDMTIVAHTENDEPTPNPNVLIEYGYALKNSGSERIISIMNEAFGDAENSLPFDLKHRRFPIRYNLTEQTSVEEKKKQKEQLIAEIVIALETIIKAGLLKAKKIDKTEITEVHPMWRLSSFMSDSETIAKTPFADSTGKRRDIVWSNGPQAFLRIIPTQSTTSWIPLDLERLIGSNGLNSMGNEGNTHWISRNSRGALHVSCEDNGKPGTFLKALSLTQVFKNGEIWGIDGYSLRENTEASERKEPTKYIAAGYIETLFTRTLRNYLDWAKASLKLELPLKYVVGLSGIQDYPISTSDRTIEGYCTEDELIAKGEISDYNIDVSEILIPFFKDIWVFCGFPRPNIRH
jgi:hypothetical protein